MDNILYILILIAGLKIAEDFISIKHYWSNHPITENGKKKKLIKGFIHFKTQERQDCELKRGISLQAEKSLVEERKNKEKLAELEKAKKKMNLVAVKELDKQAGYILEEINKIHAVINELSDKAIRANQEIMAAQKELKLVGKKRGITGKEYIAKMKAKEQEEKEKQLKQDENNLEERKKEDC